MKHFISVRVESAAFAPESVLVAELTGKEQISKLFEFTVRLVTLEASLDEDAILTNPITIVFEQASDDSTTAIELRRISGMVRAIRDRGLMDGRQHEYIVTIVPRAFRATLSATSDVCMDLAVPDIIVKKLGEVGLQPAKDIELRLKHKYPVRELVVQYHEAHWDFVCRLAEDLGMHFAFDEVDGKDVLVFGDHNAAFTACRPSTSPYRDRGEHVDVYELEARRQLVSKDFVARDYNYRNPSMDVIGAAQIKVLGQGKVDEYGPHAKTPEEASYYAQIRAEEAITRSLVFEGKSAVPGLRAGSHFTVEGHTRGDIDILVTEVVHAIVQPVFFDAGNAHGYYNTFRGVPKEVPYRPERVTPKPRVHGVVTGVVESASPTKLGALDEQGRYRVMFAYDSVTGRGDGKASRPLRMAQPSAGATRGFHAPLVPGTEVIITCVNGDPDRPIITGAVPNPQTPSPVTAANSEKTMLVTNKTTTHYDDTKPRYRLEVAGGAHVLQVGEPHGPELGVLVSSVKHVSALSKEVTTSASKMKNAFTAKKTGVASANILEAAGVPNPISSWEKIEDIVKKAAVFAKAVVEMADGIADLVDQVNPVPEMHHKQAHEELEKAKKKGTADEIEHAQKEADDSDKELKEFEERRDAKKHREEANEELEKAKKKAFDELGKGKGTPQITDKKAPSEKKDEDADKEDAEKEDAEKDGGPRYETQDEADARTFDEAMKDPKNKATVDEIEAAKKKAADADKKVKELAEKRGTEEVVKALKDVPADLEKAKKYVEKQKKKLEEKHEQLETLAKLAGLKPQLEKLEEKLKDKAEGTWLVSKVSALFAKATQQALDVTVSATQKLAHGIPKASGQRNGDDVGTFKAPFNIQLARDSVALYGWHNAFVYGGKNATVFSAGSTSILARKRVDVKSMSLVEVASKKIALSAKKEVDVWSGDKVDVYADKTVLIVAAAKGVKMDEASSVIVNGQKDVHLVSDDKNLHLKANQNISALAQSGNVVVTAKKGDLLASAQEGKFEIEAAKGTGKVFSKKDLTLESTDGNFALLADKGDGKVKTKNELTLDCKSGTWKASSNIEVKSNKLTVKAGKIELG